MANISHHFSVYAFVTVTPIRLTMTRFSAVNVKLRPETMCWHSDTFLPDENTPGEGICKDKQQRLHWHISCVSSPSTLHLFSKTQMAVVFKCP